MVRTKNANIGWLSGAKLPSMHALARPIHLWVVSRWEACPLGLTVQRVKTSAGQRTRMTTMPRKHQDFWPQGFTNHTGIFRSSIAHSIVALWANQDSVANTKTDLKGRAAAQHRRLGWDSTNPTEISCNPQCPLQEAIFQELTISMAATSNCDNETMLPDWCLRDLIGCGAIAYT